MHRGYGGIQTNKSFKLNILQYFMSNFKQNETRGIEYAFRQATQISLGCKDRVNSLVVNAFNRLPSMSVIMGIEETRFSLMDFDPAKRKISTLDYVVTNNLLKTMNVYEPLKNYCL